MNRCSECGKSKAITVAPYQRETDQLCGLLCECDPTDIGLPTNWLGRNSEKYLKDKKRLAKRREKILGKDK